MLKWRRNLYTVWFTQLISLIGFGFGLPFLPFYIQELGITDPDTLKLWTGLLASIPALVFAAMAPVWGYLADKVGKKLMLIRAMAGASVVLLGLGLAQSAGMVLVFRILQGVLSGTVTSSAALVATGTPVKRLSFALGFLSSSTFIGYSLGPAAGGLIAERFGYRMSFFIGSGILLAGLFLVIFLIEEPASAEKAEEDETADLNTRGLKMITPAILLLFLLYFFVRISRTLPSPFLPLFIQEMRGTITGSARLTGLISGGIGLAAAASGLTLSRLGDRMDRLKLLAALTGAGAVTSSIIIFVPAFSALVISLLITFFLIGGIEPLLMSLTSERVNSKNRGFLFGIQTMAGSFAWFVSPMMGSWVSITFGLRSVFFTFSVMLVITFTTALLVRRKVV